MAGFAPLALAGSLEVAAGAAGPLLAGRGRRRLGAVAAGLAVVGHNWSPWLSGAGGRGISTVLGATAVVSPEGTVMVGAGLAGGRLVRQTALGCFVSLLALFPVLVRRRGFTGLVIAASLTMPVLIKRVLGNAVPEDGYSLRSTVTRLVFDADPRRG
jgi:acyl phosphate:glycerol-3-phosphate acyltransferase